MQTLRKLLDLLTDHERRRAGLLMAAAYGLIFKTTSLLARMSAEPAS